MAKAKIFFKPALVAQTGLTSAVVSDDPVVESIVNRAANSFIENEVRKQELLDSGELRKPEPTRAPLEIVESKTPIAKPDDTVRELEVPDSYVTNTALNQDVVSNDGFELPPVQHCGLWDPSITLDESQVEAVRSLLDKQYGCLIGAAGTGKTTVTKYLLKGLIYDEQAIRVRKTGLGLNIALVAFTGMAVQVIKNNVPDWLKGSCHTIHSLLEFAPEEVQLTDKKTGEQRVSQMFMPQRNENHKLEHDIIVIDEASMLGMDLWNQLRSACRHGTRIYMIGDLNQLPPIIGEPIFAYALSNWHVSELTTVHRQKGEGANRIIDTAHDVLNGRLFTFDDPKANPNWRVIGFPLDGKPGPAAAKTVALLNALRQKRVHPSVDPEQPLIYDPYRDRVMTAGNGYDENSASSLIQQYPLNEALSLLIQPPSDEHPRVLIDAGRVVRKFAVNHRVMATRNESPSIRDRVTNGMTGVILNIRRNGDYTGNHHRFGPEQEVQAYIKRMLLTASADIKAAEEASRAESLAQAAASFDEEEEESIAERLANRLTVADDQNDRVESDALASHTVTVEFVNGAIREFSSKVAVESLQLAYCSTVAKCQGSQFPTAVIVVHHAQRNQLSREWLYTAVTRAQSRVIILYTEYALRYSLSKQKIFGKNLKEKIERYAALLEGVVNPNPLMGGGFIKKNVKLRIED